MLVFENYQYDKTNDQLEQKLDYEAAGVTFANCCRPLLIPFQTFACCAASPGERKQIVSSGEKRDDLELNSAKLAPASVMHHGELRCLSPGAELRQSYWHICQGSTPDRDKWPNSGTQKLIQTASNNQGE